jgi:hypothetical protein
MEQGGDQGRDRRAVLVDGQALRDNHLPLARQLFLEPAQQHRLPAADNAGDGDQSAGEDRRPRLLDELAVMVGLEIAGDQQVARQPEMIQNLGEHYPAPFPMCLKRDRILANTISLLSVSVTSASMKARSSGVTFARAMPISSAIASLAAITVG